MQENLNSTGEQNIYIGWQTTVHFINFRLRHWLDKQLQGQDGETQFMGETTLDVFRWHTEFTEIATPSL